MSVKSICGVILISKDPQKLMSFYQKALNLSFEKEEHDGLDIHYGTDIGQVHFGIHPAKNFKNLSVSHSSVMAFNVDNLGAVVENLKSLGAEEFIAPHDEGFGNTTTYKDPEGNLLEVVELKYTFDKKVKNNLDSI